MRTWIWTLCVLVVAIGLALVLHDHGGNVLIIAQPWRVEFSLTFAVLLLIAGFFLAYFIVRALSWIGSSPGRLRAWRGWRSEKRDHELLESGWLSVLQGRLVQGEKELSKVMGHTRSAPRKVLAGLASARASHLLGDYTRRDEAIEFARRNAGADPQLKDAAATVTAEMYLDQHRPQDALQLLQPLQDASSRYFNATRLLLRAHRQLGNHDRVYELTRLLLRRGVFDKAQAMPLIETAASARLRAGGIGSFKAVWGDLKPEERALPDVALAAASVQTAAGNHEEAGKILEAAINVALDPRLLGAYCQCPPDQVARRLGKAEVWLKSHPNDFALLCALGNLCIIGQLWGQGERYLLRSMRIRSDVRIHSLLGTLYDRLGRHNDAMKHWRLAASVAKVLTPGSQLPLLPGAGGDPTLVDIARIEAASGPAAMTEGSVRPRGESRGGQDPAHSSAASPKSAEQDDYFDSAPVPGLAASVAEQPGPDAADSSALDEYFDSAPMPDHSRPDPRKTPSGSGEGADFDDYFDSAPIPGVDMSQTSDNPHSGRGRR